MPFFLKLNYFSLTTSDHFHWGLLHRGKRLQIQDRSQDAKFCFDIPTQPQPTTILVNQSHSHILQALPLVYWPLLYLSFYLWKNFLYTWSDLIPLRQNKATVSLSILLPAPKIDVKITRHNLLPCYEWLSLFKRIMHKKVKYLSLFLTQVLLEACNWKNMNVRYVW